MCMTRESSMNQKFDFEMTITFAVEKYINSVHFRINTRFSWEKSNTKIACDKDWPMYVSQFQEQTSFKTDELVVT